MFTLVTREYVEVTPESARKIIALNTLKAQRKLNKRHLSELSGKIKDGLFRTGEIAVAMLPYSGGDTVLVNGQHQCNAVIETGKNITVNYEIYTCHTALDLSLLYRQFDSHKSRTLTDMVKVEAESLTVSWISDVSTLVAGAATIIEGKSRCTNAEKATLLREYTESGEFVNDILVARRPREIRWADVRFLRRQPVVAAMLLTAKKDPAAAKEFWSAVRDGANLTPNMPAHRLRAFLSTYAVNTATGARRGAATKTGRREMLSKCITAWNAHRKGRSTNLKYYSDKPMPAVI